MMKNLIDMIFKREPVLNYVIAEYKPNGNFVPKSSFKLDDYDTNAQSTNDEMEIDNLYQKN